MGLTTTVTVSDDIHEKRTIRPRKSADFCYSEIHEERSTLKYYALSAAGKVLVAISILLSSYSRLTIKDCFIEKKSVGYGQEHEVRENTEK